ncbi:MAG: pilin [Patescibacteria group bacterium]|nr:pilin [Patescibacteria group bacterium]
MKKSKYPQIFCLSIFLLLFGFSVFTATAQDEPTGLQRPDAAAAGLPAGDFKALINGIVKWVLWIAAPACLVALVYGGMRYAFAGGSEEKAENAKKIMKYAVIGVAIIIAAYAIVGLITALISGEVPATPEVNGSNATPKRFAGGCPSLGQGARCVNADNVQSLCNCETTDPNSCYCP